MSPFEIFLDAQVALCGDPAWMADPWLSDPEVYRPYPQPIHMAHRVIDRAQSHLGIRAYEGYQGRDSHTDALDAILQETPAAEESEIVAAIQQESEEAQPNVSAMRKRIAAAHQEAEHAG